jgi:hypothetical protein
MKKLFNIFCLVFVATAIVSCDENDRVSGSPVDSSDIVTLTGIISSTESAVVAGQQVSFTATIPQTFEGDVKVEATAQLPNGVKTRTSVVIPAGETSVTGIIQVPSSEAPILMPFNNAMKLSLTAILLTEGEKGTHYLLNSNELTLDFGDSAIPVPNITRLQIRFDWAGPYEQNDLDMYVIRVNADNSLTVVGTGFTGTRYENGVILNTAVNGNYVVAAEAYTTVYGDQTGDIPYRYILRYPDNSVKTFSGTFVDMAEGDFEFTLQIVKAAPASGTLPTYTVTQL